MNENLNETELTLEEVLNNFTYLVKYMSHNFRTTGYTDSQDFYQEGMIILYKCWCKYKNRNLKEFRKIFNTSINRLFVQKTRKRNLNTISIEDAMTPKINSFLTIDHNIETIFVKAGIEQLKRSIQDDIIATAILNELLCPSKRTLWEVKVDIERKKMLYRQGFNVYIPAPVVKLIHIRRSLMLCSNTFNKGLTTIRRNASLIFSR